MCNRMLLGRWQCTTQEDEADEGHGVDNRRGRAWQQVWECVEDCPSQKGEALGGLCKQTTSDRATQHAKRPRPPYESECATAIALDRDIAHARA